MTSEKGNPITKRTLLVNLRQMQNKAAFEMNLESGEPTPHSYWGGYWQAAKEALELAERVRTPSPARVRDPLEENPPYDPSNPNQGSHP